MGSISGLIAFMFIAALSSLNIGDTAPSFEGTQWLKGKAPVFKNQVTIIELWRPSCGHCKAVIPHLTSLQKKYGNQIAIVSLSKEPIEILQKFIKANGDQMEYTIGKASNEFPYYADVPGLPYAFLINKDGIIVWKGHPSNIDEYIFKTMEGRVDIEQFKMINKLETAIDEASKTNDLETITSIDQKLLQVDPSNYQGLESGIMVAKYKNDPKIVKEIFDRVPQTRLSVEKAKIFAEMLINESDLAYRYPEAALNFIVYALKNEPNNDNLIDVYARVLYYIGDIEKAITWQKKAIGINPKESSYQTNLDYYLSIKTIREKSDKNSNNYFHGVNKLLPKAEN
jgi:thiol-disulfide isomerase/thioredoxin